MSRLLNGLAGVSQKNGGAAYSAEAAAKAGSPTLRLNFNKLEAMKQEHLID